jgi:hypothetical protein
VATWGAGYAAVGCEVVVWGAGCAVVGCEVVVWGAGRGRGTGRGWSGPRTGRGRAASAHRDSAASGGCARSLSERIASASPIGHSIPNAGSNAWISVYCAFGDQCAFTR